MAKRTTRRVVHASAHTSLIVPPGHDRALCGDLVPAHQVSETGVNCRLCLEVAANTLESATEISGASRGAARRAVARAQRRANHTRGGGRR